MTKRPGRLLAALAALALPLTLASAQAAPQAPTFARKPSWTGHLGSVDVRFTQRFLDVTLTMDQKRNYDYWSVRLHTVPNPRSREGFQVSVFDGHTGMQALSANESHTRPVDCTGIRTRETALTLSLRIPARCVTNHYAHPTGIADGVQAQVFVTDRRNGSATSNGDVTVSTAPDKDGSGFLPTVYRSLG